MKHKHVNLFLPILMAGAVFFGVSCSTPKDVAYIHDAPRNVDMTLSGEFSKGIQANDLLYIYVESLAPEATLRFNQETNKVAATTNGTAGGGTSSGVQGYLVDNNGDIIFPVLGKIHVVGKTHAQLAKELEDRLIGEGHILDAVVTVKLLNFQVSVLGEVRTPRVIQASGERLTIFEALSMVGDLTIEGQRTNVTVIREENGVRTVGELDLTSKEVFQSPYYYLHQNDVVYVEPNAKKKKSAESNLNTLAIVTTGISLLTSITSLVYYFLMAKRLAN